MFFAHPLSQHGALPLSPAFAAGVAVWLLVCTAIALRPRSVEAPSATPGSLYSWEGELTNGQRLGRTIAVALVVLVIVAGRFGSPDELDNLAPALAVGVAWPLLLITTALAGAVWRWSDPWDAGARALRASNTTPAGRDVYLAVVGAMALSWYLSAYPFSTSPRSVGAALALYTIATLAGCLARGRAAWLSRAEMIGVLLGWLALLPRRGLAAWRPPRGAELFLGVLAGGLLFGPLRHSELWGDLNVVPSAGLYAVAGLMACCAAGGSVLWVLERWARKLGSTGSVAAAAVPAVASIAVAVAMERNRLFTSLQLLPGLVGDPFGWGWDLFGPATRGLDPDPLGAAGLALVQLGVLLAGHVAGFASLARVHSIPHRAPSLVAASITLFVSAIALLAT